MLPVTFDPPTGQLMVVPAYWQAHHPLPSSIAWNLAEGDIVVAGETLGAWEFQTASTIPADFQHASVVGMQLDSFNDAVSFGDFNLEPAQVLAYFKVP